MTDSLRFTLYVSGQSPPSLAARANIMQLHAAFKHQIACEINIVDVFANPEQAEQAHILATPTLIKHSPPPEQRIIGDLGDIQRVIRVLGIQLQPKSDPNHAL